MLTQKMLEDGGMELVKTLTEGDPNYIELKCKKCGAIRKMTILQIKIANDCKCPTCESFDAFKKNLEAKYGRIPYDFLSPYVNAKTPMLVRCKDCGLEFEIPPSQMLFNSNYPEGVHPCKGCTRIRANRDIIKQFYEEEVYHFGKVCHKIVDEKSFGGINSNKTSEFECLNCGEKFVAKPLSLVTTEDYYCPKCHSQYKVDNKEGEPVIKFVEDLTTLNLDENQTLIRIACNGESSKVTLKKNTNPKKKKSSTLYEQFREFMLSLFESGKVVEHDKETVPGVDIMFYIPDLKVGVQFIEFDKFNELKVGKKLLQNNYLACKKADVGLIQVFEDEWITKEQIVKDKIKHILHLNHSPKVYARNCTIREIETDVKNEFLEKYHIQGKDSASVKIGMFYNDELVSVITFGPKRICMGVKKSEKDVWELIRFASVTDKLVIGGFSKLLKYFIEKYKPKAITTFADLRYSFANLYNKNGFTFDHMTEPNYWYYKDGDASKRWHRFNFRKQELPKKLKTFDPALTEKQNCFLNGFFPVQDAGNVLLTMDFREKIEES